MRLLPLALAAACLAVFLPAMGCAPVSFDTIASGSVGVEDEACTSGDSDACCTELHVEMAGSQGELDEVLEANLGPVPLDREVAFPDEVALVSFTAWCPYYNYKLRVTSISRKGTKLNVQEFLDVPISLEASSGRPYNIVTIPAGDYEEVDSGLSGGP